MPFELVPPGTHIDFIGKRRIAGAISAVVLLASLAAIPVQFAVGWVLYLARVVPQIQVDLVEVGFALVAIGVLTVGVHVVASRSRWAATRVTVRHISSMPSTGFGRCCPIFPCRPSLKRNRRTSARSEPS